jgi:hypothetical protein
VVCKYLRVVLLCYFNSCPLRESAAYKINNAPKEFDEKPPAYASLTDLRDFRYDNSKFTLYQDEITVSSHSRSVFLGWDEGWGMCVYVFLHTHILSDNELILGGTFQFI